MKFVRRRDEVSIFLCGSNQSRGQKFSNGGVVHAMLLAVVQPDETVPIPQSILVNTPTPFATIFLAFAQKVGKFQIQLGQGFCPLHWGARH